MVEEWGGKGKEVRSQGNFILTQKKERKIPQRQAKEVNGVDRRWKDELCKTYRIIGKEFTELPESRKAIDHRKDLERHRGQKPS